MNILVTGAGGFLGRNLAQALLSKGHRIWNFSRRPYPQLREMGIETLSGNLQNEADVLKAFAGMDAVFHVASRVGIWGDYQEYYQTNVIGTQNVIQACRVHGISKLIYTSTPSVVFDGHDILGADETKPYSKTFYNAYAETKTMAEQMVLRANDQTLCTVALRPHQVLGPDDPHLVPRLVEAAKKGRLKIVGSGRNLVDVTYIQNAVDAHILAFEKLSPDSPVAGQAYFIGQEKPVVLWDFINEILKRHHLPPITQKVSERLAFHLGLFFETWYRGFKVKGEPPMTRFVALQFSRCHYFSHEKAKKDFGYEPKISIEQMLNLLVR